MQRVARERVEWRRCHWLLRQHRRRHFLPSRRPGPERESTRLRDRRQPEPSGPRREVCWQLAKNLRLKRLRAACQKFSSQQFPSRQSAFQRLARIGCSPRPQRTLARPPPACGSLRSPTVKPHRPRCHCAAHARQPQHPPQEDERRQPQRPVPLQPAHSKRAWASSGSLQRGSPTAWLAPAQSAPKQAGLFPVSGSAPVRLLPKCAPAAAGLHAARQRQRPARFDPLWHRATSRTTSVSFWFPPARR